MFSKTEFAGIKNIDDTYTKTHLCAIDFLKDTVREIYAFDSYISYVNFNNDFTAFTFEQYPKLFYVNLKGDKDKKEIIPNYYSLYKYAFKGNKVFIVYSPSYNIMYGALFEDGILKWKHTLK